jgi:hypothetical protein
VRRHPPGHLQRRRRHRRRNAMSEIIITVGFVVIVSIAAYSIWKFPG